MQLEKLVSQGYGVTEIAKKLKVSKASVSERLSKLKASVAREVALRRGAELVDIEFRGMEELLKNLSLARKELDYIQAKIDKEPEKDRLKWQRAELPIMSEIRKTVRDAVDVYYIFARDKEVATLLNFLIEELRNVDPEAAERFYRQIPEFRTLGRITKLIRD